MCRFVNRVNHRRTDGRRAADAYPVQNSVRPYNEVKEGCCALTGVPLNPHYVHRAGQTEKAFHEDVYQWFISEETQVCKFCRQAGLNAAKVSGQRTNPRELSNYLCPECIEYMALLFRKVAGKNNSFLLDEQRAPQIDYVPVENRQESYGNAYDPEVVDAEIVEEMSAEPLRLPTPQKMVTVSDILGNKFGGVNRREKVPVKRTYR